MLGPVNVTIIGLRNKYKYFFGLLRYQQIIYIHTNNIFFFLIIPISREHTKTSIKML